MDESILQQNCKAWDQVYTHFNGWCALPTWGPYEVGRDDPSLIGPIKDRVFLEICCGSGHSTKYLLESGAKKVYALDFSEQQLRLAKETNKQFLQSGKVEFIHSPMETSLPMLAGKIDTVFSIYGIGWTNNPKQTFANVYSYLIPGGKFVWSWDHLVFANLKDTDGSMLIKRPYHEEQSHVVKDFCGDTDAHIFERKPSTWFSYLREAGFFVDRYLEPKPANLNEDIDSIAGKEMADFYSERKVRGLPMTIIFDTLKPS